MQDDRISCKQCKSVDQTPYKVCYFNFCDGIYKYKCKICLLEFACVIGRRGRTNMKRYSRTDVTDFQPHAENLKSSESIAVIKR